MSKRKRSSHNMSAPPGPARDNGRSGGSARLSDPVWADDNIAPSSRPSTARRRAQKPRPRVSSNPPRSSSQLAAIGGDSVGELICVAGPEEGLRLPLTEGVFGIGRGRDNHFVLKDIAASRQHIEIRVHQGEVSVHDLGSGNGTRVNGRRVQKAALHSGDRVEIGNSALTFQRSQISMPNEVSEVSVVPPRPAPRSSDVWPETETLLSEIAEFERASGRPQARKAEPYRPPPRTSRQAPARPPPRSSSAQLSAEPIDPGQSLSEIRQAIGAQGRFGSVGWLLGAALLVVMLVGVAALFVYYTQLKASKLEQAQALVVKANQAMIMGRLDQARELFEQASSLNPESVAVQQGRELLTRTRQSAQAYQRASELLDRGDFEGARHALEGVLPDTPRYKDVADQQSRIDEADARSLLVKARQALAQKALDSALQLVEKARVLAPDLDEASRLRDQIQRLKSQPLTPVQQVAPAPRPAPKPVVRRPAKRHRPKRVKRHPRPRPRPRVRSASISDGVAKGLYRDAVSAYRSGDRGRARDLLKKIIRGRKRGDLWYEKAQSFIARKL